MNDIYVRAASDALWLILTLSLAPLLVSLLVGLIISLFQALTQIQEQTLTFVPKVIATVLVLMMMSTILLSTLRDFAQKTFDLMLDVSIGR